MNKIRCFKGVTVFVVGLFLFDPIFSEVGSWEDSRQSAEGLIETGDYRNALVAMTSALKGAEKAFGRGHDNTIRILGRMGFLHWTLGNQSELKKILRRLKSFRKSGFEPNFQLGKIHLLRGELRQSEVFLNKAYAFRPDDPDLMIERGRWFFAMGQLDPASVAFESAVKSRPQSYWLYGELARCYALMGRQDLVAQTFERARNHAIGDMQHYVAVGYSYLRLGDTANARNAFQQAVSSRPDDPWAYRHLGTYYQSEAETGKAIESYEKVIGLLEKRPELTSEDILHVMDQLAELYLQQNRPDAAESVARRVLALKSKIDDSLWVSIFPHAAAIYARLNKKNEVFTLYTEELETPRAVSDRLFLLAENAKVAMNLGYRDESRRLIDRVDEIEIGESSMLETSRLAQGMNTAAEVACSLDDYARAQKLYQRSLSLWPKWERRFEIVVAIRGLAALLLERDKRVEAMALYEKTIDALASEPREPFDELNRASQQEDDLASFIDALILLYHRDGLKSKEMALKKKAKRLREQGILFGKSVGSVNDTK